ncbi:unnamed protein product [Protopolystoma xenopodis]|uniref:Uncharacterized protein n=1 Tax=Protopolystoma xenopodis TaxID=117903 RepID=A0A3S5B365_9PLAT|nr:unnamed protein product [Protopolystoma xenopodis]
MFVHIWARQVAEPSNAKVHIAKHSKFARRCICKFMVPPSGGFIEPLAALPHDFAWNDSIKKICFHSQLAYAAVSQTFLLDSRLNFILRSTNRIYPQASLGCVLSGLDISDLSPPVFPDECPICDSSSFSIGMRAPDPWLPYSSLKPAYDLASTCFLSLSTSVGLHSSRFYGVVSHFPITLPDTPQVTVKLGHGSGILLGRRPQYCEESPSKAYY